MAVERYVVVDSNGKAVNIVLWDKEVSDWSPPEGCDAVPEDSDEGRAAIAAANSEDE